MTTTTLGRPAPRVRGLALRFALLSLVPVGVWAAARYDLLPHVPLCAFLLLTGRPCPGCGMTRSILDLARGDVGGSLRMHPLGVVFAGLFLAAYAGTAIGLLRGGDPTMRFVGRRGSLAAIVLVVLLLAVWLVRAFLVPSWGPGAAR